jgi:hypothetical protein
VRQGRHANGGLPTALCQRRNCGVRARGVGLGQHTRKHFHNDGQQVVYRPMRFRVNATSSKVRVEMAYGFFRLSARDFV